MKSNCLVVLLAFALLSNVDSFQQIFSQSRFLVSQPCRKQSTKLCAVTEPTSASISYPQVIQIPQELEDIRDDIQRYIQLRKASNDTAIAATIDETDFPLNTVPPKKIESPLEFLRPTGWYKDKVQLDIDSRSDKTKPIYSHPLSFTELSKYGYESLSSVILSNGGPRKVGILFNIEWNEPVRKRRIKVISSEQKEKSKPGQLALGSSFNDNLDELASMLDLTVLKATIASNDEDEGEWIEVDDDDDDDGDSFGVDYTQWSNMTSSSSSSLNNKLKFKTKTPVSKMRKESKEIIKTKKEERFRLQGFERGYTLLLCIIGTVAYGRASSDILTQMADSSTSAGSINNVAFISDSLVDIIAGMKIAFPLIIAASVTSSLKSGQLAKEKNRSVPTWMLRTFLGGPQVALKLTNLSTLPVPALTTETKL